MRRAIRCGAAGLAAAAAGLALPAAAGAVTTCNFAAVVGGTPTLVVSHTDGTNTVLLRVIPPAGVGVPQISVREDGAAVACSGLVPATDQVAAIRYTNAGGTSDLVIDDPTSFGPGPGTPGGSPQIKMLVTATAGNLGNVLLRDTDGLADHVEFGQPVGDSGLLYGDVNPDHPIVDPDLLFAVTSTTFAIEGSPQADILDGSGFPTLISTPFTRPLTLTGGDGADTLIGGVANDVLRPGRGDDVVAGGAGRDSVDYSASTAGVDIDLTRPGAQAGGSLGRDTLAAVEDLTGSPFADVLRGDAGANALDAGAGDDLIQGRGGDDTFTGGPGSDILSFASASAPVAVDAGQTTPQLTGGAGVILLTDPFEGLVGGAGADALRGTAGPDTIDGGPGADTISALGGADRLLLRDGAPDTADCGAGDDRAEVDPGGIDALTGCETVVSGVAPVVPQAPGAGGPGAGAHRVAARLTGARHQKLVRGAVTLKVGCPTLSCSARAGAVASFTPLGARRVTRVSLRAARVRIAGGAVATLRLVLPAAGLASVRAALRAGRRPVVRVAVVVTDAAAGRRTLRRAVTLTG